MRYTPSYLYTFKNNALTGYPFLNPIGNNTITTTDESGIGLSNTKLIGDTGGCFMTPDSCTNGTTLGAKLKLSTYHPQPKEKSTHFILRSEGIELFEDEYGRLCGLVRSLLPSREWKVCFYEIFDANLWN